MSGSSSWFILATIPAGRPASWLGDLAVDHPEELAVRMCVGGDEQALSNGGVRGAAREEMKESDDIR